jgi:hemoglobin
MTIEYIRYRIPEAQRDEFVGAYTRAAASLRASPVCLGYELSACSEDPTAFVLRIAWTSGGDHLNVFRKSGEFRTFFEAIRPYVPNIEEMRHYEPTALVWSRAAGGEAPSPAR